MSLNTEHPDYLQYLHLAQTLHSEAHEMWQQGFIAELEMDEMELTEEDILDDDATLPTVDMRHLLALCKIE